MPSPDAVATVAPAALTTDSVSEKACAELALFQTSTDGVSAESAVGAPSAPQLMAPVTFEGAYTPHGEMYGPGVRTAVSHTER